MTIKELFEQKLINLNSKKLIEIANPERVVFAGDTHGDVDATRQVLKKYKSENTVIVLCGDYVDRGNYSRENADLVVNNWEDDPKHFIPVQGNHDEFYIANYNNPEFWRELDVNDTLKYIYKFSGLPLVVSVDHVLALHGAIPDFTAMRSFEKVILGDKDWETITWGDFSTERFPSFLPGRPRYNESYFIRTMDNLGKKVLLRGHDPTSRMSIYDGRCITLSTSSVYDNIRKRNVAIADFTKKQTINNIDDLVIEEI